MKKITVVLLAFMLLVLSGCGGAGKASSFLLDSAGDKLLTVTAENAKTDQIILVMPEEFFRNCAILIGVLLIIFVILYIRIGDKRNKKS